MSPGTAAIARSEPASVEPGDLHRLADDELLARFFKQRDEAAFALILARHGALVLGVCQRVLGNCTDAEDAFQATFLVLVRKGATLSEPARLANWLYGVAQRTARKFRLQALSRSKRERQASDMHAPCERQEMTLPELRAMLDEEISRLPEKYSAPLVLCYLEGMTNAQAAAQLGWPEGSISRRLARARELLRSRLAKRGLALSAILIAAVFPRSAAGGISPHLAASTLEASRRVAHGTSVEHVVSASTAKIVDEVLLTTAVSNKLTLAAAIAAILLAVVSIAWQLDAPAFAASLLQARGGPHGFMTITGPGASLSADGTASGCGVTGAPASCGVATP